MPLAFRNMQNTDLDAIYEIESASFSDPWIKDMFAQEMHHDAYVATLDDKVAGYVCAWQVLDECTITNIAVDPLLRRQGIAEFLFLRLAEIMDLRDTRYYFLEVRISNQPALEFYHKLGFIQVGCRKSYYQNPQEDAIVMTLDKHPVTSAAHA